MPFKQLAALATLSISCCFIDFSSAVAADYPDQPIRVIVPYTPAGGADSFARLATAELENLFSQPMPVMNIPGGATAIGTNTLIRSAPDGYSVLFTTDSTFIANPLLYSDLSYEVSRDLVPLGTLNEVGLALVVNADLPVNTMEELIEYAKSSPDTYSYGSYGIGSQAHIMGEAFNRLNDTDLVHVPYKGSSPAVVDVLAGRLLFTFPSLITVKGHIDAGKLKVLAISGQQRSPLLPDVPTFVELGLDAMNISAWYGFFAPKGIDTKIVDDFNSRLNTLLETDEFKKQLLEKGATPLKTTPKEMQALISSETQRVAKILELTQIEIE